MWKLKKSRGQFESRSSEVPKVTGAGLQAILGDQLGERSNFALLDEFMRAVHTSNGRGRRSDRVFCGVSGESVAAQSRAVHNGAWITIGEYYVRLLHSVAAVSIGFRDLVPEAEYLNEAAGDGTGLKMLGNIRAGAMNYIAKSVGAPFDGKSDDLLWDRFKSTDECTLLTQSALLWVVGHELAHLTQGDSSKHHVDKKLRADRFREASRLPVDYWPRPLSHREEVAADWAGLGIARSAMHRTALYACLMPASIIATTALTIDGWNVDKSAVSTTHPPPALRAAIVQFFWGHHLHDARAGGWEDGLPPSEETIERFAQAHVFARWIDGLYREGREGFTATRDIRQAIESFADIVAGRAALELPPLA